MIHPWLTDRFNRPLSMKSYGMESMIIAALFWLITYLNWELFDLQNDSPMMVWQAEALVLVYAMLRGWASIPGNCLGIFTVTLLMWQISWPASIGMALVNSAAPAMAGFLIRKYAPQFPPLGTLRNTAYFILFGIILMPLITAPGSSLSLWASNRIASDQLWPFSRQWYLNDMCGNLIYAPLWLAWLKTYPPIPRKHRIKLGLVSIITILISYSAISSGKIPIQGMGFILIIPLTWITIRFSLRESMTLFISIFIMLLTMISIGHTGQPAESISRLSIAFMAITFNLSLLMMNALASEQKTTQEIIKAKTRNYAHYLDNLPGISYQCKNDQDRTILYLSRGFEKITGYDVNQHLTNRALFFKELILPEYRSFAWKKFLELNPH